MSDPSWRFTSVGLRNWRNFRRLDVPLQKRIFLIGPNAAGKSNFLDVFRFLRDIVSVGGGLQEAVSTRGGVSVIRSLAARQSPEICVSVGIGNDNDPNLWTYELAFTQHATQRPPVTVLKREVVKLGDEVLLERPTDEDRSDPARLVQTHLEQINSNKAFREVFDFLRTIRYLHIVPQLVREPERSVGRTNDPFGGDFLELVARTTKKTRDARLRRILAALQLAVPQLNELKLMQDERGMWHLQGRYEHWRPQGAWQTEEQFSDGTLRLLGLLWAIQDGTGPLLLEEPELSLHSEIVRQLPQLFARVQRKTKRQILVSSHAREALNDSGLGLDEILLLIPEIEGTRATLASEEQQIVKLVEGGMSPGEAAAPYTRPARVEQLMLFGDKL